jgi:hypothetical protein
MSRHGLALLGLLVAAPGARAAEPAIGGDYDSPLGRVRVSGDGASFRGVLVAPSRACGFAAGEEVLRATLLDDSLAGEVRVCLTGEGCGAREEWSSAVLLASGGRLSGAVHVRASGCRAPLGARGGIAFTRASAGASRQGAAAGRRERARAILRDGAAWLGEGNFEQARRRFLDALELDPAIPEAYNGVGVTYRMRNDLPRALEWYKKALTVDADFGDAYYNMACVYALEGKKQLALRYLQIAALNGYATAGGMDEDPDLEAIRAEPAYRALVKAKL